MKVIEVSGTPYEMGLSYGFQCKKDIKKAISMWYKFGAMSLTPGFREGHPKLLHMLPKFITYKKDKSKLQSIAKKYESFIIENCPEIIEEMKGIAEGAKVDYIDILFLNTFPEVIEGCTIWAACGKAVKTGEPLLAMNTDEMKQTRKIQIILSAKPDDGYHFIGNTYAGIVSPIHGMNQTGFAYADMLLHVEKPDTPIFGMSLFPLLKTTITKSSSVDEAVELFKKMPRPTCPGAIFYSDSNKITRIENSSMEYDITLINDDAIACCMIPQSEKIRKYDSTLNLAPTMQINAIPRQKRMTDLLKENIELFDIEIMKIIAKDHGKGETKGKSICQHSAFGTNTIGSFIAKPRDLKIWMCYGNPCKNRYKEFTLQ
ncbi:MAG: hypothetical protein FK733_06120 [Asgard group archaeon]|nr:hypothetical protein [Asgard group archaeon]